MDIYIDVLFLENIIINYLILSLTARFIKRDTPAFRKLIGALIGALYVILLVAKPELKFYNSFIAKLLLSFFIIAVTFNFEKPINFIKAVAAFYGVSFLFAGSGMAFEYLLSEGEFLNGGLMAVDANWIILFMSLIIAVIIGKVFWEIISYSASRNKLFFNVKIYFTDKEIEIKALLDTGNSLLEPIAGNPVIVVEFDALKKILPEEICKIYKDGLDDNMEEVATAVSNSYWMSRFRLIPFSSIGKHNGILIGFRPDKVVINEPEGEKIICNSIIALYNKNLSNGKGYRALLSFEVLDAVEQ